MRYVQVDNNLALAIIYFIIGNNQISPANWSLIINRNL